MIILNPNRFVKLHTTKDMKTHSEILRPSLLLTFLSVLSVTLTGTDAALVLGNPVQPQQTGNKLNSSGELAAELPPRVFPSFSNEDEAPIRKGEELPPSVFPEEPVRMSQEQRDVMSLVNKSTENVTFPVNKETSAKQIASEVQDLLKSDNYNITVYEDGTEGPITDTVTVTGPNVINNGKSHEEDVSAPSKENNENVTENSVISVLPTSDTNGRTFDLLNISTVTGSNMSNVEDFVHSENTTEVKRNEENGTIHVDTIDAHSDAPVTDGDIAVKDGERNHSVSENNVQRKEEVSSDTITAMNETTSTAEPNTVVKDETTAKSESLSSTVQQLSTIKFTSTLPVQQSTITTLQPMLKVESTTSVNISENLIDHKTEDTPVAMATSQKDADNSPASSGKSSPFLQPTESAAILAAVFVGVALIGYVGLLIWRRLLEKRYGSREMLVNEDDFYDTNDLKNFEL